MKRCETILLSTRNHPQESDPGMATATNPTESRSHVGTKPHDSTRARETTHRSPAHDPPRAHDPVKTLHSPHPVRPRRTKIQSATAQERQRYINWPNAIWLGVVHLGCLAAPLVFSWEAFALTLVLHWITGGIGICLGFHRHLTHLSFTTYKPVRWLLAFIGGLAGEGSSIDWVANHRKHHAHSDQDGDPHSPHDGPWSTLR